MSNATTLANSQSIGDQMAKGNNANLGRMKAMLKQMRDNSNSRFNVPIPTRTPEGTSAMARAKASI